MRTFVVALLSGGFSALCVMQFAPRQVEAARENVVRATRFELVDSAGTVKAFWGMDNSDRVVLTFLDKEATPRLELGVFLENGSQVLRFADQHGWPFMTISGLPSGGSALTMGDSKRSRLVLGHHPPNDAPSPADDDYWGLFFPRAGGASSWASFGISAKRKTEQFGAFLSLVQPNGEMWEPAPQKR